MAGANLIISTGNNQIDKVLLSLFKQEDQIIPSRVSLDELMTYLNTEKPIVILLLENFDLYKELKQKFSETSAISIISLICSSSIPKEALEYVDAMQVWKVGGDMHLLMSLVKKHFPKKKKKILIVDDEEIIHEVIKRSLGPSGLYDFADAYSGQEALDNILLVKPDLVITDITMPKMDGFELCKTLKENDKTSEIPVMIISAYSDESVIEKGFEAGADEYITKPFPPEELSNKVDFLFSEIIRRRKEKILVVDDSPAILNVIKNALTQQGFTVLSAKNGAEGLKILMEEHPDVIVSDIDMPQMNGLEFCRVVKANPETKEIPFVALTSRNTKGAKGLGRRVGIDSYLTKPFTVEKVVVIVERYLAERRGMAEFEREMMIASITSLAKALDERDKYTRFHSENVSKYSVKIAKKIGLSDNEIEEIKLAAMLHDIGKIGIRDSILLKPGQLNEEEYNQIKAHSEKGASILIPIASLKNIIPFILYHHEKMDGTGYPHALKGEEIPLGARIIAVSDTFDSLITERPYRHKLSRKKALKLIKELAGDKLCPYCVNHFIDL